MLNGNYNLIFFKSCFQFILRVCFFVQTNFCTVPYNFKWLEYINCFSIKPILIVFEYSHRHVCNCIFVLYWFLCVIVKCILMTVGTWWNCMLVIVNQIILVQTVFYLNHAKHSFGNYYITMLQLAKQWSG